MLLLLLFQWIMDVIICNGSGIYLGMKTLNYLSMKPYHWRGMWNIPSYRLMLHYLQLCNIMLGNYVT